jgi:hypothetical protein
MAREVHAVLAVPDHSARIAAWRRFEHVHESGHGNRVGLAWSPAKRSRRSLDRSRRARHHPAVTVERSPGCASECCAYRGDDRSAERDRDERAQEPGVEEALADEREAQELERDDDHRDDEGDAVVGDQDRQRVQDAAEESAMPVIDPRRCPTCATRTGSGSGSSQFGPPCGHGPGVEDREREDDRLDTGAQLDGWQQVLRKLPDREDLDEVEEQLERADVALIVGRARDGNPHRRDPMVSLAHLR